MRALADHQPDLAQGRFERAIDLYILRGGAEEGLAMIALGKEEYTLAAEHFRVADEYWLSLSGLKRKGFMFLVHFISGDFCRFTETHNTGHIVRGTPTAKFLRSTIHEGNEGCSFTYEEGSHTFGPIEFMT